MSYSILLSELEKMTEEEKTAALDKLVEEAQKPMSLDNFLELTNELQGETLKKVIYNFSLEEYRRFLDDMETEMIEIENKYVEEADEMWDLYKDGKVKEEDYKRWSFLLLSYDKLTRNYGYGFRR